MSYGLIRFDCANCTTPMGTAIGRTKVGTDVHPIANGRFTVTRFAVITEEGFMTVLRGFLIFAVLSASWAQTLPASKKGASAKRPVTSASSKKPAATTAAPVSDELAIKLLKAVAAKYKTMGASIADARWRKMPGSRCPRLT